MRPKKLRIFTAMCLVVSCICLVGCDTATVSCGNAAKLQTNMGLINTEGEVIGNLLLLNPDTKIVTYASEPKNFDKNQDVTIKPDSDTAEMDTSSGLDITFSMTLTPA